MTVGFKSCCILAAAGGVCEYSVEFHDTNEYQIGVKLYFFPPGILEIDRNLNLSLAINLNLSLLKEMIHDLCFSLGDLYFSFQEEARNFH